MPRCVECGRVQATVEVRRLKHGYRCKDRAACSRRPRLRDEAYEVKTAADGRAYVDFAAIAALEALEALDG